MLTQQQYTDVVYTASRANAALVERLRLRESLGSFPNWNLASMQGLKIKSGFFSLAISDYSSEAAVDIYNQLLDIGSTWTGGIAFDPNAQIPGTVIIVNGGTALKPITYNITAHVTPTPLIITYDASVYTSVQYTLVRVSNNSFDWNTNVEWTPGVYTLFGDDFGDGTWADSYVFTIYGQTTGTSSGGGSGSGAFVLTFTEAALLQDGSGNWFLPLSLPVGLIPIAVTSNGETVTIDWNVNFSPNRLYGFSNNDPQTIIVKSI